MRRRRRGGKRRSQKATRGTKANERNEGEKATRRELAGCHGYEESRELADWPMGNTLDASMSHREFSRGKLSGKTASRRIVSFHVLRNARSRRSPTRRSQLIPSSLRAVCIVQLLFVPNWSFLHWKKSFLVTFIQSLEKRGCDRLEVLVPCRSRRISALVAGQKQEVEESFVVRMGRKSPRLVVIRWSFYLVMIIKCDKEHVLGAGRLKKRLERNNFFFCAKSRPRTTKLSPKWDLIKLKQRKANTRRWWEIELNSPKRERENCECFFFCYRKAKMSFFAPIYEINLKHEARLERQSLRQKSWIFPPDQMMMMSDRWV